MTLQKALAALQKGEPIVLYDGEEREGEADMIICGKFATPEIIERFRRDAGGLLCAAISYENAKRASLPFFTDMLEKSGMKNISCKKTAYGDKPAFSLPVNHNNVYTGIPDKDRSLTITKIDEIIQNNPENFGSEFYSPGHVFLLISRGIENRRGHTELAIELGRRSNLNGAMVLCEMLGSGRALNKDEARDYAKKNKLVFIEGKEIF